MLHAYDTPTGIPYNTINLKTKRARNPTWNRRSSTLSEYGTQQLELLTLANLTGVTNYTDKCEAPIRYLNEHHSGKVGSQQLLVPGSIPRSLTTISPFVLFPLPFSNPAYKCEVAHPVHQRAPHWRGGFLAQLLVPGSIPRNFDDQFLNFFLGPLHFLTLSTSSMQSSGT